MINIGLFIDYMHNPFHTAAISGISDAADVHNARLWCFEFPSPPGETYKFRPSILTEFIVKRGLDGLIIAPGSLEPVMCTEHIYSFFRQHSTLPLVFLFSQAEASYPFIRIDNRGGMNKLLFHLFGEHGYRRPAFIRGDKKNSDLDTRYHIFTSLCDEYGIHLENRFICDGKYSFDSGRYAIMKLIENKKLQCDVILSANDEMAAGAIRELHSRGIRIPEDIRITGFDDIKTSRFLNPPLTTVKQPLYDMGYKAVEYTLELIQGNKVLRETFIPAELIVRDSCGCTVHGKEPAEKDIYGKQKERIYKQEHTSTQKPYVILYEKKDIITYYDENLDKIMKYIGRHYIDSELTIKKVEKVTGISSLKIAKAIKEKFHIHFKQLLNKIRCTEAKRLLENTDRYITDIAFQVGYNSRNHFYKAFKQSEGISPKNFRNHLWRK